MRPPAQRPSGGGLLSPAFLDELRNRTLLSALVGRTVKLGKAGREFKGCCPFHQEKTPSFYVNDEKGFYHCFGCSAHGDAIRFLTEARGLPFMDAVKELAGAAGLDLPAPDPRARERAERAGGLLGACEAARAYLDKRGLGAHARDVFGIGFAPEGRHRLAPALPDHKPAELVEAGLLIQPEEGRGSATPYDRFRNRLMIPIRDPRGRVIAFGGRILGDGEPKYLNSPETPLFDKGRTLFNLDRAAPASRKAGRVLVVEGYLDVIALDQAGIAEAVAPLGTALTEAQMARLWTLVDDPILCFDGDNAGRKASLRAAARALAVLRPGKTLRFALLPAGQDPDDLVRGGGAPAFEAAIADPVPLDRLLYEAERDAHDMARPEARAGLRQRLQDLAASCTDRLVADEYKRGFNELFFEDFGWKKAERRAVAAGAIRAGAPQPCPVPRDDLIGLALRSLSRRPHLLGEHVEQLAALQIAPPHLGLWRDALVSGLMRHPALDTNIVAAILEADLTPDVWMFNLQKHLQASFLDAAPDDAHADEQIVGLLHTLASEQELKEHALVLMADKIASANGDGGEYAGIAAEDEALGAQLTALYEDAYQLGQPRD